MSQIRSLDAQSAKGANSSQRTSIASAVLVTLADQAYVEQAKQLFSSAYFDGGWGGDYLLLAHEIDDADLVWFEERGILVRRCEPLYEDARGRAATQTSKLYMFTPEFRKWTTVIYCDADVSICRSLDALTSLQGFWAIRNYRQLYAQIIPKESMADRGVDPARYEELVRTVRKTSPLRSPCFNSGFFVFTTDLIDDSTFHTLKASMAQLGVISVFNEQLILNLFYARNWRELPPAYNMQIAGETNQWSLPADEIDGIVLHYVTAEKPWLTKNAFYDRWRRNLARADEIDLSDVPDAASWSDQQIAEHTAYLRELVAPIPLRRRLRWWGSRQMHRVPGLYPLYRFVRNLAGRQRNLR